MSATTSRMSGRERALRWGVTIALLAAFIGFMALAGIRWEWGRVWPSRDYLLGGLVVTLWISMAALVVGLVIGIIAAVMRMSRNIVLNQISVVYMEVVRGTPLLVQLMVGFYCFGTAFKRIFEKAGSPQFFIDLTQDKLLFGILVLGIFAGAYISEIVRAALQSIDKGQTDAGLSQGMTRGQVLRLVLLPQALRRMVPPLTGQFVSLVKDSSLLYAIGVTELYKRASEVRTDTHKVFEVLLPLAVLYLVITFPLSRVARRLELRLAT